MLEAAQRATGLSPEPGARAARPLPVLRRGGREAARGPLRRRAPAAVAGDPRRRGSKPPNVLILDEPTNHLDIESREALEDALRAFPGAVLLVSHDRALLDAVGTRTVAVEDGTLRSYVGRLAGVRRASAKSAGRALPARRRGPARDASAPAPDGARGSGGRPAPRRGRRRRAARARAARAAAAEGAVEEPAERAAEGRARRRGGRGLDARRSNRSSPTPRRGRRATRPPSPRRATPPPGARSRTPTRAWRR